LAVSEALMVSARLDDAVGPLRRAGWVILWP